LEYLHAGPLQPYYTTAARFNGAAVVKEFYFFC